jgi:tRNA (cytidine/uridine-2'-O-)-methyltransferase
MHIALMEPKDPRGADLVAKLCAETGTSLHVIGPVEFSLDAIQEREEEGKLDFWMHPDWFEFRKAIARERCYYFSPDGGKEIEESRLRPTSVLMFAGPEGLPDRIKEKYPHRIYRLPAGKPAEQVKAVLTAALQRVASGAPAAEGAAEKPAPRRRRSRS